MEELKLGRIETRFAELIWANAPLSTCQLIQLCGEELKWKRTTTYTVLQKLCKKGIFKTENSLVTVVISESEYEGMRSELFIEKVFNGSLLSFLNAFISRKKLSNTEIAEIEKLINQMRIQPR